MCQLCFSVQSVGPERWRALGALDSPPWAYFDSPFFWKKKSVILKIKIKCQLIWPLRMRNGHNLRNAMLRWCDTSPPSSWDICHVCCNPLPGFSILIALSPNICYQCIAMVKFVQGSMENEPWSVLLSPPGSPSFWKSLARPLSLPHPKNWSVINPNLAYSSFFHF